MKYIKNKDVAEILNINPRTVNRYRERGIITGHKVIKGTQYHFCYLEDDIMAVQADQRASTKVKSDIKEVYSCRRTGVPVLDVMNELDVEYLNSLESAIERYSRHRSRVFQRHGIHNGYNSKLLLIGEAVSRFKMSDPHVIHGFFKDKTLEPFKKKWNGGYKYFVTVASLVDKLGDYSGKILYRSQHAVFYVGESMNRINKLANQNNIGLKLKDSSRSSRLFSLDDIRSLRVINESRRRKHKVQGQVHC